MRGILVVYFCLISTNISFAANEDDVKVNNVKVNNVTYTATELENIENERQELNEHLKEQLMAQGALDQFEVFSFLVENTINTKYYPQATRAVNGSYYAPKGGWIQGTGNYIKGYAEFFTVAQTLDLYTNRGSNTEIISLELLSMGVGFLSGGGGWSTVLTISIAANTIAQNNMWSNVDVGNQGMIMYAVYDTLEDRTTNVLWAWNDNPYMKADDFGLSNIAYGLHK